MLSVKIFNLDSYIAAPIQEFNVTYSGFRGSHISYVPIIRIFGSTPEGEKACVHVHGVFPYLYIPYDGVEPVDNLMYQIATSLDKSINISLGQGNSNVHHVYKIQLVSGLPLYGYHIKQHQFLKIYFYNPMILKKASTFLKNGSILGKIFQPHECHIPYILQFMIDYNLHGMSYVNFTQVHLRTDLEDSTKIKKVSVCKIEADVLAENIVNRLKYNEEALSANPGIAFIWEDEKQRRKNLNKTIDDLLPSSQPRHKIKATTSHITFKQALKQRLIMLLEKKEETKSSLNASVYPAETPSDCDITNSSCLENTATDLLETTSDDIVKNESMKQSQAIDDDVENVLKMLRDMGENAELEKDSVLSQTANDDSENEEIDFSQSIEPATTPKKRIAEEEKEQSNEDELDIDSSYFANIQISQLDGNYDDGDCYSLSDKNGRKLKENQEHLKLEDRDEEINNLKDEIVYSCSSDDKFVESDLKRGGSISHIKSTEKNTSCLAFNSTSTDSREDFNMVKNNLSHMDNNYCNESFESSQSTQKSDTSNISAKLFSSDSETDLSVIPSTIVIKKVEENNVCKYDRESNFVPIAGTSKLDSDHHETSDSTITPYQKSQTSEKSQQNDSAPSSLKSSLTEITMTQQHFDVFVDKNVNLDKVRIFTPKFNPPTKNSVKSSLQKYKISFVRHQEPFYSNFEDVTNKIEVGNRVLKVCSKTTADLQEFTSFNDAINLFRKENSSDKNVLIKNCFKLSYCKQTSCLITPAKRPPSKHQVLSWLKEKYRREEEQEKEQVQCKKKIKLHIRSSPDDASGNESLSETLTLSLCSLDDSTNFENTSYRASPILEKKRKRIRSRKNKQMGPKNSNTEKSLQGKLRRSLLQSHFLSQLLSPSSNSCEISGPTLNNTHGFRMSLENRQNVKACSMHEYLTTFVMELHTKTRLNFKPNPELDPIRAIFYLITNDVPDDHELPKKVLGFFAVRTGHGDVLECYTGREKCVVTYVDNEEELLKQFISLFHKCDPDILAGYEIELLSWGYLIERAYVLGLNLPILMSRINDHSSTKINDDNQQAELKITGRIILNVWRLMRHEIALQSYTFENVYYHILHKRVPLYSFKELSFWWEHPSSAHIHKTIRFYLMRVEGIIELIDNLDLLGRTSELARLFGIQFFEVLSRGSQFRVESMMLRLAKPLNYIPVSPSVQQRATMRAPEYLPLILEPESKFYVDPVIVLDFQSLYPSMIIAYNYCFSTCLGRVELLGHSSPFEFGANQLKISPANVKKLLYKNKLNFTPCGVAFVKREVRKGILPRMLEEILDTRLMVKKSMKDYSDDKTLLRVLHSRQLGLKLIANVTYGYTAANFSGRMPCVEVGDSVVSKGRETLQRAIDMVENTPEWGAKVVYGDTDSLFVMVPGRSLEDAFKIGAEIADRVTNDNPSPVKLKLEKVYLPCILQTKKRYVGYMYESPQQKEPTYDAKGIETVRRDGCPAVAKMLEKCLRLLFETRDVSLIKAFALKQFHKILSGRVSIQDLTFAKEFRGFSGYRPGACVPALELAKKWTSSDKRNEPRSGQRVPYIIVNGPPGLPLIRLVRSPKELLEDPALIPNEIYYITRVIIPPLNRCLSLLGIDLNKWFNEMPRRNIQQLPNISLSPNKKSTIAQYFATASCAACGQQTQTGLCESCTSQPQTTMVVLQEKLKCWEKSFADVANICKSCNGLPQIENCTSLDCPVVYRLAKLSHQLQQAPFIHQKMLSLANLDM